ncbi:MAG: 23S rRNA (pseudouridine(1915)-N(3))-methyltransferase RlmH [Marinicaulis sp.]|nr:23S rRNA (pseudouridine(1915)-N(3))-methyltransferase RlmH [Marinicaulis sp.]NNL88158.1 23S rRNA (pseudouridine(1915)-N(3))-methyltransferase RlmH [Marinicaulis sp.]
MRIQITAIGKLRPKDAEHALVENYLERASAIGRNIGFPEISINEFEAPTALTGLKRQHHEGAALLKTCPENSAIICLDEKGKNMSSDILANWLLKQRDSGASNATFLIGGADGHTEEVKSKAALTISFGAATWPHKLVRVMLMEQIYRSMTILSNHPYHRS